MCAIIATVSTWNSADVRRVLWIGILVIVAALGSGALVLFDLSKFWTTVIQVLVIVAGAALGNALALDHSRALVQQQARTSIRHLIEQAVRMGREVEALEARSEGIRNAANRPDKNGTADGFADAARTLRHEIDATTSAMENWGVLDPIAQQEELQNFRDRQQRMPRPGAS